MNGDSMSLKTIFSEIARHTKAEFTSVLDHVSHPLEKGLARERVLASFLSRFLPERFGIGTGFVIDVDGQCSKQIDIIVYDKIISPVFTLPGNLKYYPAECVVAVGEVKTTIDSREKLMDALEKIKSVKDLNRFGGRDAFDAGLHASHGDILTSIQQTNLPICYQTWGFIFTSQSLSKKSLVKYLGEYFAVVPRHLWPNIIVDFEKYAVSYSDGDNLIMFPNKANSFYVTKEREVEDLLLLFTGLLFRFLKASRVQEPDLMRYFGMSSSEADYYPLPEKPTG